MKKKTESRWLKTNYQLSNSNNQSIKKTACSLFELGQKTKIKTKQRNLVFSHRLQRKKELMLILKTYFNFFVISTDTCFVLTGLISVAQKKIECTMKSYLFLLNISPGTSKGKMKIKILRLDWGSNQWNWFFFFVTVVTHS